MPAKIYIILLLAILVFDYLGFHKLIILFSLLLSVSLFKGMYYNYNNIYKSLVGINFVNRLKAFY